MDFVITGSGFNNRLHKLYQWDNTSYPFPLEMWSPSVHFIFNFINRSITSAYQTPGIFIILRIMNISGVFQADEMFLFTELKMKWSDGGHAMGTRYCPMDIVLFFLIRPYDSKWCCFFLPDRIFQTL